MEGFPLPPEDEKGENLSVPNGVDSSTSNNTNDFDFPILDNYDSEEDEKGQNLSVPNGVDSSTSNNTNDFDFPILNNYDSDWYLRKITTEPDKLSKIKETLEKYGLKIPNTLRVFRKGCIPIELSDKFLVFSPNLKYFTVLTHIDTSIRVVNVPSSIKKKIFEIIAEIRKILSS
jgi:hypothetical protein